MPPKNLAAKREPPPPNSQPRADGASSQPSAEDALPRRRFFGLAASGLLGAISACGPGGGRTEVVKTPDGKVLQWERDDLLVLVSGLQDSYRRGDEIRLTVILNNQTTKLGSYRLRTKLAGRGQQVVAEAPVANLDVKPYDASEVERVLAPTASLEPGDYTLIVELPPWSIEGRSTGGGSLSAPLRLEH
jgi:hypothetical protein